MPRALRPLLLLMLLLLLLKATTTITTTNYRHHLKRQPLCIPFTDTVSSYTGVQAALSLQCHLRVLGP